MGFIIAHNNEINDIVDKIKFYKKNINKLNISKVVMNLHAKSLMKIM